MNSEPKILMVTLDFSGSFPDLERDASRLANPIANVPGLRWKIWLANPDTNSAGGLYLFETEQALHKFVDGPIAAEITNRPDFTNITMKVFQVMENASRKTRAPL
jgi:hypothetical protein